MQAESNRNASPGVDETSSKSNGQTYPHVVAAAANSFGDGLLSDSDKFYAKLAQFFESTGLSLILNARETTLDLFQLHKEVARRGGFRQINKRGKWEEIVLALKLESTAPTIATQVQRLYAHLLYNFEQSISRTRSAPKPPAVSYSFSGLNSSNSKSPALKRNNKNSSPVLIDIEDYPEEKKLRKEAIKLPTEEKPAQEMAAKLKESMKIPKAPLATRSAYQLFLSKECARLRTLRGESQEGQDTLRVAIDVWRQLTEKEKEPYIEESRKDRERYEQEMAAFAKNGKMQYKFTKKKKASFQKTQDENGIQKKHLDNVYKVVNLTPLEDPLVPRADQSIVDIAMETTENAPTDQLLHFNWDEFCGSLDVAE
ncbi:high mobility group B protein 10-like isoform X2 [Rhodamnia argentea]|uniref:High mobility group B protein 10-like isoform X2 n=1 Tax=Rhodamnia argentea TaxID=178133 RepID=A0ABM3GTS2_9MYRT|nr:high mobility group B protein 10-like isoform X2 [Rhodamnia argentea]